MKKLRELWLEAQNFQNIPTRTRRPQRKSKQSNRKLPKIRRNYVPRARNMNTKMLRVREEPSNNGFFATEQHINQSIPSEFQTRFDEESAEERVQNIKISKRRLDKFLKKEDPLLPYLSNGCIIGRNIKISGFNSSKQTNDKLFT